MNKQIVIADLVSNEIRAEFKGKGLTLELNLAQINDLSMDIVGIVLKNQQKPMKQIYMEQFNKLDLKPYEVEYIEQGKKDVAIYYIKADETCLYCQGVEKILIVNWDLKNDLDVHIDSMYAYIIDDLKSNDYIVS